MRRAVASFRRLPLFPPRPAWPYRPQAEPFPLPPAGLFPQPQLFPLRLAWPFQPPAGPSPVRQAAFFRRPPPSPFRPAWFAPQPSELLRQPLLLSRPFPVPPVLRLPRPAAFFPARQAALFRPPPPALLQL